MTATIIQILTTLGLAGILGSIVNYFLYRRKFGADASKVITDAATELVSSTQARLKELENYKRNRESYDAQLRSRLAHHEMWDHRVYSALLSLDPAVKIEAPPSLHIDTSHLPPDGGGSAYEDEDWEDTLDLDFDTSEEPTSPDTLEVEK